MCMKKNNRLLRGVAAVLCLALMFFTMSGMAMRSKARLRGMWYREVTTIRLR